MPPESPHNTIDAVLSLHRMISELIVGAVEDVPDHRMAEQPGTIINHPAWTLSHLNAYAGVLLSMFDDPSVPNADDEIERFGYGTTPVPDRAAYATKRELLDRFRRRSTRLAEVVAAKHAEYFPSSAPEKFRPHCPTLGHVAITLLVAHPPHHLGQLRQWRRAAGIAPKA